MRLLQGEEFLAIFRSVRESAFHLEVRDCYRTADESEPLRRFLAGEPDDFDWLRPWLDLVRETGARQRRIERVRVITVPHSDYVRWSLTVTPMNIAAGEDIRWLPRHLAPPGDLPADDFWLLDRARVVFTTFTTGGAFAGGAETVDAAIVDRCGRARDALWRVAVPHGKYATG